MKHLSHHTIAIIVALLLHAVTGTCRHLPSASGVRGRRHRRHKRHEQYVSREATAIPRQSPGPVPNIIITNFAYGGDSVAAGSKFNLDFTFQNKGQVSVTNMVVTVDGGESFAIAGGTNTFYVDALWAGYAMTQSVPMQALASAKSGAQSVTVNFRYEYVDASARSSGPV